MFKYKVPGPVSKSVVWLDHECYTSEMMQKLCIGSLLVNGKIYFGKYTLEYIFIIKCLAQLFIKIYCVYCIHVYAQIKLNTKVPPRDLY